MVYIYTTCSLYHWTTCSLLKADRNLFTLTFSSIDCKIKIQPFSNHKMSLVGLQPEWNITKPVVFTTRPLARCLKETETYSF
jgi:hypothetical protein